MAANLVLLDAADGEIDLTTTNPVDFGTQEAGSTTDAVEVKVKNDGDEDVFFVTVQGIEHPTAQVGDETDTFAATEIALSQDGNFETSKDLGTLTPGQVTSVWVRWVIPEEAPAGDVVWAIEALGQET